MRYEQVKALKAGKFKQLCGVKSETFERMVAIVRLYNQNKQKPGRPGKICLEDQVLMTLDYWREYRTYFHIGLSWGVAESTACRIIRKVENILSQSRMFTLPGKKQLLESDLKIDAIVIDVTETPIERPKKNKNNFIVARRKDIH
jgi:hypothetical protein